MTTYCTNCNGKLEERNSQWCFCSECKKSIPVGNRLHHKNIYNVDKMGVEKRKK